jgi:hypothetical protein
LCSRCLGQNTKSEIEQPEVDELWALFHAAYEQYQVEVINSDKLYNRFVNDFISYHLPVFSSEEHVIREHVMHLSAMHELLTERVDLVKKYFCKKDFTFVDYEAMYQEFNTVSIVRKQPEVIANFNHEQISLITAFVNEANLFIEPVDEETLTAFFNCTLGQPLIATNASSFLLLLNMLYKSKFLVFGWQKLVADNGLLKSNRAKCTMSKTAISSRVAEQMTRLPYTGYGQYSILIKQLKECM